MCKEEIECPRVGELLESLQNGDEEPTISYRCSVTNMTFGFWVTHHLPLPLG